LEKGKIASGECELCVQLQTLVDHLDSKIARMSTNTLDTILDGVKTGNNQKGLGIQQLDPSTSESKETKFVKELEKPATVVANPTDPLKREPASVQTGIRGSAVTTSGNNIASSSRTEFVIVNRKKPTHVTTRHPPPKINPTFARNKAPSFQKHNASRRPNNVYPRSNHQMGWNPNMQNGFSFQNLAPWNAYSSYPYMSNMNGMFNTNGPMNKWGPNF